MRILPVPLSVPKIDPPTIVAQGNYLSNLVGMKSAYLLLIIANQFCGMLIIFIQTGRAGVTISGRGLDLQD